MIIWRKRLNNYGLSDLVIILLFVISVISTMTEIASIGMFLPLFELINQYGVKELANSDSKIVEYIYDITSFFGLSFTIEVLLFLSFVFFAFSKALLYITTYIQSYYRGLMIKNMKDRLLNNYLRSEASYYDTTSIGDFSNSSNVELASSVGGVMLPIKLIIAIISGIGSITLLIAMSPHLTIISICVIGIGIIVPYRWVKAATHVGRKNSRFSSVITSFLLDRLQSPRLVRLSNTADAEEKNYFILTEKHRKLSLAIQLLKARIILVLEPTIIGSSLLIFYVAIVFLKMPISTVLLYMAIMVRIVPIITNILTLKQGLNRSAGPIQAIDRLLNSMGTSINKREKNILNQTLINKINTVEILRLENVSFSYNSCSNNALSDINYTFQKSTLTAIVGPSGSGKTTFVDIVSGYRTPTLGALLINEINADKYNPKALMSLISYVPQAPQIFDGTTIYDHISYGKLNTTKDGVINALKLSGAYHFVKELPQGLNTILTGNSSGLSGGQKQRIDLSRALLRDTPIIIMDEPTGNLDLISEKDLMSSINKIRLETGKIIIIIAHRIYTIMDADRIIVLEDGNISGAGTHSELLLSNSWYKQAVSELHFGN